MELKRAKEVLLAGNFAHFTAELLLQYHSFCSQGVYAKSGQTGVSLDGRFTPDQLEAIATWMRDPEGVVKA